MARDNRMFGNVIGGIALITLGVFFLLGQWLGLNVFAKFWPALVIGFGGAFFAGMFLGGKEAGGLAIPGSMFVILGLIFFAQNVFNTWASWSYVWALFAPTGVGVGIVIQSWWSDRPSLKREGYKVMALGLILYLAFGTFFELVLGLNGSRGAGTAFWPVVLIVLGFVMLIGRLVDFGRIVDALPPRATHSGLPTV
jgi:hypothetical protein